MATKAKSLALPYDSSNPKNPVWDLHKHGITFSGLTKWLECREQFRLQYVCGWTSTKWADALEFGSLIHDCLEFEDLSKKNLEKYLLTWRKKRLKSLAATDGPAVENIICRALAIMPEYFKHHKKTDDKFDWYEREHQFLEHILLPDGRTIPIAGKIDGVLNSNKGKNFELFETKTSSRISEGTMSLRLLMDFQTLYYANAVEMKHGKKVKGLKYNVLRKSAHKQHKTENFSDFSQRLQGEIQKDPKHYFLRWNIKYGTNDLEKFRQFTLYPLLTQFLDWYESAIGNRNEDIYTNPFGSPNHFINPGALEGKFGPSKVLKLITQGKTDGLKIRKKAHPELN